MRFPDPSAALPIVAFVAAMVLMIRVGGTEPALWLDTVNDQRHVRACVEQDRCPLRGPATSVQSLHVGTSWLGFRGLLHVAGLDLAAAHVVMHVLAAVGFALLALAVSRSAGPLAASVALLLLAWAMLRVDLHLGVLYNARTYVFFGALLTALCLECVRRPRPALLGLSAVVAAIAAEVHPVCGLFVLPVAYAAVVEPGASTRRRLALAGGVLGVFGTALFALSPGAWIGNVAALAAGIGATPASGGATAASPGVGSSPVEVTALAVMALLGVGLAVAPGRRRELGALLVLSAPMLAVYRAARLADLVDPSDKYLAPWLPALAAAAAIGALALASEAWSRVRARIGDPRPALARAGRVAGTLVTIHAAGLVAFLPAGTSAGMPSVGGRPAFTFADAGVVAEALRGLGWDLPRAVGSVKGPDAADLVEALAVVSPWDAPPESPGGRPGDEDRDAAYVLKAWTERVPDPLPDGCRTLRRSGDAVLLLCLTPIRTRWERFEVCVRPSGEGDVRAGECVESGIALEPALDPEDVSVHVAGLPGLSRHHARTVTLRLPLGPARGGPSGIVMPRSGGLCGGRVAAVDVGEVSADGLRARIGDGARRLDLEWRLGAPECAGYSWRGFPPFFIEGDPATSAAIEALLRGRDG